MTEIPEDSLHQGGHMGGFMSPSVTSRFARPLREEDRGVGGVA